MKNITLICIFLFLPFVTMAQKEIGLSVNDASTGHNISLKYGVYVSEKSQIEMGIKYHINPMYFNPKYPIYSKNIHTQKDWQHWGLEASYYRDISPQNFKTKLRFFGNMQYTYASIRTGFGTSSLFHPELSEPTHFLENSIGLNLKAPITDKVFVNFSAGGGILFFREVNIFINPTYSWEFSRLLSFGVVYRIK